MQAVGHLNQDDADIIAHRKEQLLEIFGLGRSAVAKDTT